MFMSSWGQAGVALVLCGLMASPAKAQPAVVAAQAYVSSLGFFPGDIKRAVIGIEGGDGTVSPAELGVLILEQRESPSVWRARWFIRMTRRQVGGETLDLTEVERFNMGPATRARQIEASGTAPPSEMFGVGPHVAWRLVTRPDGPSRTVLLNVGRRDYPEFEAKNRDCGGALCTSVQSPLEKRADWVKVREETTAATVTPFSAIVSRTDGRVEFDDESIAHAVRALSVLSGLASGTGAVWTGPAPGETATISVDSNVSEEGGSDAASGPIGDTRWIRRTSAVAVSPQLTVRVFEGAIRRR